MDQGQICSEFRLQYRGDGSKVDVLTAQQQQHLADCAACKRWTVEVDDIFVKSALPQYDVPEKLTQNILAAIETESRRPASPHDSLLWIPLAVGCTVFCLGLIQIDNLEGYGASAVAAGVLVLINFFIRSEKEESAAASQ